jgi:HlyD family secretion protein
MLTTYQVRRKKLTTQILKQDTVFNPAGSMYQAREQYAHMKSTLELMRKKVADLTVRAPIDGQLNIDGCRSWPKQKQRRAPWAR